MAQVKQDALAVVNGSALRVYDEVRSKFVVGIGQLEKQLAEIDPNKPGAEVAATELFARAKKGSDRAEEYRKKEQAPVMAAVEEVRSWWRPITAALNDLSARARDVAATAMRIERERRAEERQKADAELEEARARELAAAEKLAAEKLDDTGPGEDTLAEHQASLSNLRAARVASDALGPEGAPTGVKTPHGTLAPKEEWRWEVVNIDELEPKWMCPNEKLIDAAVKGGMREIAGLRIWPEEVLAGRVRRA